VTIRILVLEGITDRGMEVLKAEGWTVDVRKAMPPAELAAIVGPYQAMMIRSGTQITAEVLDAARSLRIIGRRAWASTTSTWRRPPGAASWS